jgi:N utilization substance protein B
MARIPPEQRRRRRLAARLAAAQAVFQHFASGTPAVRLLLEFHEHRLGATIDDAQYAAADRTLFDSIVTGVIERLPEIDAALAATLAEGWSLHRLDPLVRAILSCGAWELADAGAEPAGALVAAYVDVARGFYEGAEAGFVNAALDALARRAAGVRAEHREPSEPPASMQETH